MMFNDNSSSDDDAAATANNDASTFVVDTPLSAAPTPRSGAGPMHHQHLVAERKIQKAEKQRRLHLQLTQATLLLLIQILLMRKVLMRVKKT